MEETIYYGTMGRDALIADNKRLRKREEVVMDELNQFIRTLDARFNDCSELDLYDVLGYVRDLAGIIKEILEQSNV